MTLDVEKITALFTAVADEMIAQQAYLCDLDSVVGDGDHGITISRGFHAASEALNNCGGSISERFDAMGKAFSSSMGGAIGPIFGTLFHSFSRECAKAEEIGLNEFNRMFSAGLKNIKLAADVTEGQKTLIDALSPAAESLEKSAAASDSLKQAFEKAAKAAEAGAESTTEMIAKKGRARFLKEKSLGYRDAGASSMAIMIAAISRNL